MINQQRNSKRGTFSFFPTAGNGFFRLSFPLLWRFDLLPSICFDIASKPEK